MAFESASRPTGFEAVVRDTEGWGGGCQWKRGETMGIVSKIKRAVGLTGSRKKRKRSRTPPRRKNGEFKKKS